MSFYHFTLSKKKKQTKKAKKISHCLFNIIFLISQLFILFKNFSSSFYLHHIFLTFGSLSNSCCNREYLF